MKLPAIFDTAPLLYLITNRLQFREGAASPAADCLARQLEVIDQVARQGPLLMQIREKDLSDREVHDFAQAVMRCVRPHGGHTLINDRIDVALAAGAAGVHLPSRSPGPGVAREMARRQGREDFLIGVSTHTADEVARAEAEGADFVVFGPVFPLISKKAAGPVAGLGELARVCRAVSIPVLGLGGIEAGNVDAVLQAGAAGIAGISLFAEPENVAALRSRFAE
ncbi:MAG: thiamine phosphate synthase [Blastocatellia bacterium]